MIAPLESRMLAAVRARFGADCQIARQFVDKLGRTVTVWTSPTPATCDAMRASGLEVERAATTGGATCSDCNCAGDCHCAAACTCVEPPEPGNGNTHDADCPRRFRRVARMAAGVGAK